MQLIEESFRRGCKVDSHERAQLLGAGLRSPACHGEHVTRDL